MNSMALQHTPTRAAHARIGTAAWEDFESPRRRRSGARHSDRPRTGRPQHAHLSLIETPALYLREEMG